MSRKLMSLLTGALALALPTAQAETQQQTLEATQGEASIEVVQNEASWREQYAYSMGFAAYQWAFPFLNMSRIRYEWTNIPSKAYTDPYAPVNHFFHVSRLNDASWRGGGGPNNDALYSLAWVHVDDEPVILSIPASDRYYSFALSGFDSDNYAYAGTRTTGNGGGPLCTLAQGLDRRSSRGGSGFVGGALPVVSDHWPHSGAGQE